MKKLVIGLLVVVGAGGHRLRQPPRPGAGQGRQGLRRGGRAARPGADRQGDRRAAAAHPGQHLGPRRRQDRQALRAGGGPDPQGGSPSCASSSRPSSPCATSGRPSSAARRRRCSRPRSRSPTRGSSSPAPRSCKGEGIFTQTDLETAQLAATSARLAVDTAHETCGQSRGQPDQGAGRPHQDDHLRADRPAASSPSTPRRGRWSSPAP